MRSRRGASRSVLSWQKPMTSKFNKSRLQEQLAKLIGGAAVIKVGWLSEREEKYRYDNAAMTMLLILPMLLWIRYPPWQGCRTAESRFHSGYLLPWDASIRTPTTSGGQSHSHVQFRPGAGDRYPPQGTDQPGSYDSD
jgi:hypothetical protein